LAIEEVPVPKPQSGEVLIKVSAAAMNPSDWSPFTRHTQDQCPCPLGREGAGVVVASGGGCFTAKVGTKCGFGVNNDPKQGSWSEYVCINYMRGVFPMPDSVPIEDAASFFVNPMTAVAIFDTVRKNTANNTFVHLAAASQLGQMMARLNNKDAKDITMICVVRREEQATLLRSLGAKHVVVSGKTDEWQSELKELMRKLSCTCVFDPIGGSGTGQMIRLLPNNGKLFLYGGLGGPAGNVEVTDLIYNQKELKGWYLTPWIMEGGGLRTLMRLRAASNLINPGLAAGGWSSTKFIDTTLEKAKEDLDKLLTASVTESKLRIRFDK